MKTIKETPTFFNDAKSILSEAEKDALFEHLAKNPDAGAIIPKSGGCRKLRWGADNKGKSASTRIIYFLEKDDGDIYMLVIYKKSRYANIPAHILKQVKEAITNE